jgi:hypothetical protein
MCVKHLHGGRFGWELCQILIHVLECHLLLQFFLFAAFLRKTMEPEHDPNEGSCDIYGSR